MILYDYNLMDYQLVELRSLVQEEIKQLEEELNVLNESNSDAEKLFIGYKLTTFNDLLSEINEKLYKCKLDEKMLVYF